MESGTLSTARRDRLRCRKSSRFMLQPSTYPGTNASCEKITNASPPENRSASMKLECGMNWPVLDGVPVRGSAILGIEAGSMQRRYEAAGTGMALLVAVIALVAFQAYLRGMGLGDVRVFQTGAALSGPHL